MEKKVIKVRPKIVTEEKIYISTPFIKLDSALKLSGIADTGGMAKMLIEDCLVKVNGEICTQRGKKLVAGDKILFRNSLYVIVKQNEDN